MVNRYSRYMKVSPEEVLPLLGGPKRSKERPEFKGVKCNLSGLRLFTFKTKGLKCVRCGIEGKFFAVERFRMQEHHPFHLNLYAFDAEGNEVLMTHDHTVARCLGGLDRPENAQPMCSPCNCQKSLEEKLILMKMKPGNLEPLPGQGKSRKTLQKRRKRERERLAKLELDAKQVSVV